jgi:hypothetical protein
MNDKFFIELISDLDFEGMVVEVIFKNQIVARLNYDKGIENIEMEISPCRDMSLVFPLEEFLSTIERAKKLVVKCYEEDRNKK